MVVHDARDGRVLACAMFKEVTYDSGDDTSGAEDIQEGDSSTLSVGAIVSSSAAWVMIGTSLMAIVAVF